MRAQPLIAVADVEASSSFYQRLLGCKSDHGGSEYERLVFDGELVLQLHRWNVEHDHGPIGDPEKAHGNGVLLWFEIDDFEAAVERARALGAEIVRAPQHDPGSGGPHHRDVWLRDLDGYTVVLSSEAPRPA
jgi:catechol 2,3-dioxygenase-like lactoylglutathione lyase family enzyme